MSRVTSAILYLSTFDDDRLPAVNAFFQSIRRGFVSLDDESLPRGWYGGAKYLEANLYAGAFNYLDLDELVSHLPGIAWREPAAVQLVVREQEDFKLRVLDVFPFDTPDPEAIEFDLRTLSEIEQGKNALLLRFRGLPNFALPTDDPSHVTSEFECEIQIADGKIEVGSPTLPLAVLDWRTKYRGGALTGAVPMGFFEPGPSRVVIGAEAAPDLIVTGGDLGMRVRLRKRD
jgi:hypothetical protein